MQLLGIYIRKKNPIVTKVLEECWYPFGNYPAPKGNRIVDIPQKSDLKGDLYNLQGLPLISVNCIVGMNGAGKSTLLDVMYRIINNFACILLGSRNISKFHQRSLKYAYGIYADLYYELENEQYCISCCNEKVYFYKEESEKGVLSKLAFEEIKNPKLILSNFFYTISTNYSIYSLNQEDYPLGKDGKFNIDGKWIKGLFHKNDGYFTPIVITPFRNRGTIEVEKENSLARQRIVALSLLSYSQKSTFIDAYNPTELVFSLNRQYIEMINDTYVSQIDKQYSGMHSSLLIEAFSQGWEKYLSEDYEENLVESFNDEYNIALFYLGYKAFKICMTYDDYWQEFNVDDLLKNCKKNEDETWKDQTDRFINYVRHVIPPRIDKIIGKINNEIKNQPDSHITLKIEICLNYILPIFKGEEPLWSDYGNIGIAALVYGKNINTYNDAVMALPPAFFYYDMHFQPSDNVKVQDSSWGGLYQAKDFSIDSMSSGERQMLNMLSYVLYHIKNIQSIRDDENRVKYHHICLIFDEAELYFHPDYQRKFLSMLLEGLGWCHIDTAIIRSIQILIVTHSPFVLSDMLRENLLCLDKGKVCPLPQNETFGANLYQLMKEGFFFHESSMGRFATKCISHWIDNVNKGDTVNNEVLNTIGDPIIRNYLINEMEIRKG